MIFFILYAIMVILWGIFAVKIHWQDWKMSSSKLLLVFVIHTLLAPISLAMTIINSDSFI